MNRRAERALFWAALGTVVHTYIGFPALAYLRARLRPRPYRAGRVEPTVSILVAVHNERALISSKLANLRSPDYPQRKLQVIVASDGSDDETVALARQSGDGVTVLDLPREGKAAALNAAVQHATGEILVFTDANSRFDADALRKLTRPFADPEIGGVAGNQVYDQAAGDDAAGGERRYWDFDRRLKVWESSAGNAIAATGAIYAIRATHFRPIPPDVNDDFYLSAGVVEQGARLVFVADAIAREPVASSLADEFQRKVRVLTRAMRTEIALRRLLDPRRFGFYSVQLFSHKVLRHFLFVPLAVLAIVTPRLAQSGWFYRVAAAGQMIGTAMALVGLLAPNSKLGAARIASLPAFLVAANAASAVAAWNLVRGHRIGTWAHGRVSAPSIEVRDLDARKHPEQGRA